MVGWREREEREFFFLRRIQKPRAREGSERAGARFFLSLSRSRSFLPFYTSSPSASLSSADAPSSALPLLLSRIEMPTLKKLKRKQKTLQKNKPSLAQKKKKKQSPRAPRPVRRRRRRRPGQTSSPRLRNPATSTRGRPWSRAASRRPSRTCTRCSARACRCTGRGRAWEAGRSWPTKR